MNLNSIDFNLLKHLYFILKEKHITKAAKRAGVSQPAMSKSFKKLKELLKDELLVKQDKSYILTEKAQLISPEIELIFSKLNDVLTPLGKFDPLTENATIRIVSSTYATALYIPKIIKALEKFPYINLEIYSPQEQDLNKLQENDIDFYFGIGQIQYLPEHLKIKRIFTDEFASAICQEHPLKDKDITPEDFVAYPHILISNLNLNLGKVNLIYRRGVIDEILKKIGLKRTVKIVTPDFSAPMLLKNSPYILTAPRRILEHYNKLLDYHIFDLPFSNASSDFYMAWHPISHDKRLNRWFREEIISKIEI